MSRPNTTAFVDRVFHEPLPEHHKIERVNYKRVDEEFPLDSGIYDWEYYGTGKYDRYAICNNLGIKRSLTMGEFYGTSTVD